MPILSVLVLVLVAALALAIGAALQARRDRSEALGLLGGGEEPVAVAVRRHLRETVGRHELQAALLSREAALETSPVAMVVFAGDGTVLRTNRVAQQSLGQAVRVGGSADALAPELGALVREVLSGPPVLEREVAVLGADERTFRATLRSLPAGDAREVVCALADVTADVDYREARRLFSAAVSHELRTPLARILGLAETLALPMPQEERDALVAQTEVEVDNMRRLIDEMLMLAALDRGGIAGVDGRCDAGVVAEQAVDAARERPAARGRSIRLAASHGLIVPVSGKLLEVVIGNLVDNALVHAGADAEVDVHVRGLGGEVEVIVRDDGAGIPPAHLPRVFERFYRGDASRTGPGTGLGLALVKHIVEAHGGRVGVDSAPGRGTAITLVLPEAPVGAEPHLSVDALSGGG